MFLESNAFAAPVPGSVFRSTLYLTGDAITQEARAPHPRLMKEVTGFYDRMTSRGGWEPVPILVTSGSTGGPADHDFFVATTRKAARLLAEAGPLDGVYLCNHGAMTTTEDEDGDGTFFAAVRESVGPQVPIVATLDPHANVSQRMLDAIDVSVAYRTDPHVDHKERGAEAADLLHEIWGGMRPVMVSVRLPIVPPNVSLFTAAGPFAELVELGRSRLTPEIANVSILGGFAFSDTSKNGLHVIVTGRDGAEAATALCRDIADLAWANRDRFVCEALSLEEAVTRAVATGADSALPPTLYADLGDNCGAGGPANTLWMLEALYAAGAKGVLIAGFCDPVLVCAAHEAGVGTEFEATFNGDEWERNGRVTFTAPTRVLALHAGNVVGRHGIVEGRSLSAGRMVLLEVGPLLVSVTERRTQCNDPVFVEALGVDLSSLRSLVVKLRATFRVAFDEVFAPRDMLMIDTPGRTSPMLARLPFQRLPRPVHPLDDKVEWVNPLRTIGKR